MNDINNETADGLVALIRKIVREEISSMQRHQNRDIETFRHCSVVAVNDTTADIKDLATGEILYAIPNKSGEELHDGDTVRIYEIRGGYNNCYIGLKCS